MTDKGNSHADRLEQALNKLEANKKAAATLFASMAPELERLAALNKKLEALPQSERRQVLDAVGLKHVNSAPKPLTPLRGSSYRPPNRPPEPMGIDWRYWRHMPEVKQWQACALSLNINPDNMKHSPQRWTAGPENGPVFLAVSFPNVDVQLEFEKRLRLLSASLFKSPHFTAVNNLVRGSRYLATLNLREFSAWGLHVELEKMPPELVAMSAPWKAGETKTAYADALETPEYQKTPEYQAKYKKASAILNEISEVEKDGTKGFDERERKNQKLAALEAELAALNQEPQLAPVVAESVATASDGPAQLITAPAKTAATPAPVVDVDASDAPAIPKNQRPGLLTPLIEKAQRGETDLFSAAVIWPKLCDMAERKTTPFIGKTESGLQWIDANDNLRFLTKDALSDRLRRQKNPR